MKIEKKYIYALVVSSCLITFSVIAHCIEKRRIYKEPLYILIDQLTEGYQLRQIFIIIGLFIVGWLFLSFFVAEINKYFKAFLAFPVALALWSVYSHIILLMRFKYNNFALAIFFLVCLVLPSAFLLYCKNKQLDYSHLFNCIIYVIGLASIATSGMMFTVMSGDSYHFVMEFGQMIAKQGAYEPETMGTLLTWTGISPALFSAIAELAGFETIYGIHHMLMISFWGFLITYLYEEMDGRNSIQRKMWSILPIAVLLCNKAVVILTGWVISSAYWMVYNTILVILLYEKYSKKNIRDDLMPCIKLFSVMITITRGEAIISLFYIFICLSMTGIAAQELRLLMIPSALIEIFFLYKVFIIWKFQGSDLLTKTNAGFIVALIVCGLFYTLFYKKFKEAYIIKLIYTGLGGLTLVIFFLKTEQFIGNLVIALNNFGSEPWGTLPWIIMILLAIQVTTWRGISFFNIVWIGEIVLTFLMNSVRYIGLREGIGDSFNRMLIAMMPLVLLSIVCGIQGSGKNSDSKSHLLTF